MSAHPHKQAGAVGGELVALAVAALLAALTCCWFPPEWGWRWWLVGAAAAAAMLGLWRERRRWWVACGLMSGAAAVTFAAPDPALVTAQRLTVRFEATVRDGWAETAFGWRARVRLHAVAVHDRPLRHPREVTLTVGTSAAVISLPRPGTRVSGLGELKLLEEVVLRRPILTVKSPLLLSQVHPPRGLDALRDSGVAALLQAAGVDPGRIRAAGLASALVMGRREGLPEGEVVSLRLAGIGHILAVSGLHVGLVAALLWGGLRLLGVRPWVARWVIIAGVGLFALAAGMSPPVRRAAGGAIAYLAARQLGRPLEILPTVWGVVALLALLEPHVLVEPGFQLSAGVTLALVRWTGPLAELLPLPRAAATAIAVPLVAQAAAFAIVGAHFGTAAPLAVLSNLVVAPLAALLVLGSAIAVLGATAWQEAATMSLVGVAALQKVLTGLAGLTEGAARGFPPLPGWLAVFLLVFGVVGLLRWRGAAVAALTGVAGAVVWAAVPAAGAAGEAEVRMLPVREGMAMLLRTGGSAVLIDTGRHPEEAARALGKLRVRRLHALLLTHADEDHIGGAAAVLSYIKVDVLAMPRVAQQEAALAPLRRLARQRGTREYRLVAGQRVTLGAIPAEVFWPPPKTSLAGNDSSLILRLSMAGATLLVTGDVEKLGEAGVLAGRWPLRAPLLQVPHHGSRTSSTPAFLRAVSPRVALVPTGTSPRWAYPSPEVAARLRALPAVVLAQRHGHEELWWDSSDAVWVGGSQPVRVFLAPREMR